MASWRLRSVAVKGVVAWTARPMSAVALWDSQSSTRRASGSPTVENTRVGISVDRIVLLVNTYPEEISGCIASARFGRDCCLL